MNYPHFKNKHLGEAMISPDHLGKGKRSFKGKAPENCIIAYQHKTFDRIKEKMGRKSRKLSVQTLWGCEAYSNEEYILAYMNGVGSPHSVIVFEELIALGVKNFILVGTAGGLQGTGFFVCDKAIRDEGTSHHYSEYSKYAYPDSLLTKKLEGAFVKKGIRYSKGTNWTIDAPFMETKKEVVHYKKEGVLTVEMEAAALFTVAKVRNVKIAAAFFTSDILGEKWHHLEKGEIKRNLKKLADVAMRCFKE